MSGRAMGCLLVTLLCACGSRSSTPTPPPGMIVIDGGAYLVGSDDAERELGYHLSPPVVREQRWYDAWEAPAREVGVARFAIDRAPVTQGEYAAFVAATDREAPGIDSLAYLKQGFLVHPFDEVRPYLWRDGRPPQRLTDHPVMLVDRLDAEAFCAWRGERTGQRVRLPTEIEWEAACRGTTARVFPWGDEWADGRIQADTTGTASIRDHPDGATPTGVLDLAGNVFEWTDASMPNGDPVLKGCAWDDAPGTCRCAFRHGRPVASKHILIGFRCAADL